MEATERDEEIKFRAWLCTLPNLPAEVPGDETWNAAVIMDTIDKLAQPLPAR